MKYQIQPIKSEHLTNFARVFIFPYQRQIYTALCMCVLVASVLDKLNPKKKKSILQ